MTQPSQNQPLQEQLRILVVEDDAMLRKMLSHACGGLYALYTAPDLKQGWTAYIAQNPHIVFLDIGLPDGSGHDLAHRIKHQNPATCVIMATASSYLDDKKEAATNHVDGFISKPFTKKKFNDYVEWYKSMHPGGI